MPAPALVLSRRTATPSFCGARDPIALPAALPPDARQRAADLRRHRDPDDHRVAAPPSPSGWPSIPSARRPPRRCSGASRTRCPPSRCSARSAPRLRTGRPRRDLLDSEADDPHFVVEVEHDGSAAAALRRRQPRPPARDRHGLHRALPRRQRRAPATSAPAPSRTSSRSTRDVLGGAQSAAGPGRRRHGGRTPSSAGARRRRSAARSARSRRPTTRRSPSAMPGVQRAAATLRWTGSWHTVFVTVDRAGRRAHGRRVRGRRSRVISTATAWPATTPSSTTRSRCRSRSSCSSASRRAISAPT